MTEEIFAWLGFKKMLQACKPDPVLTAEASNYAKVSLDKFAKAGFGLSFICPGLKPGSICLPCTLTRLSPDLGRAALKRYFTWHFSMQGLPGNMITHKTCELLPHIFTFTLRSLGEGGQLFSVALSLIPVVTPEQPRLSRGALLCAVRTFLPNRSFDKSQDAGAIAWLVALQR